MEGIVINDFLHQRIEDYIKKKKGFQDQQKEFSDKIDELEDKLSKVNSTNTDLVKQIKQLQDKNSNL